MCRRRVAWLNPLEPRPDPKKVSDFRVGRRSFVSGLALGGASPRLLPATLWKQKARTGTDLSDGPETNDPQESFCARRATRSATPRRRRQPEHRDGPPRQRHPLRQSHRRGHYLDSVVDPLGCPAARTDYYPDGRVKDVVDASGKTIQYSSNADTPRKGRGKDTCARVRTARRGVATRQPRSLHLTLFSPGCDHGISQGAAT